MIPAFRETVFESLLLVIVIAVLAGGCDTSGDISSEEYKIESQSFGPPSFFVVVQNNSHLIDPSEQMYNGTIQGGVVEFSYMYDGVILWRKVYYPTVAPGQQSDPEASICVETDAPPPEYGDILAIKHEGLIEEYPIYSFPTDTIEVPEQPDGPLLIVLPESCKPLSGCNLCHVTDLPTLSIFAFANPGVLVGTMKISSTASPSPPVGGSAMPVNKFELLAPWLALTALILVSIGIIAARRFGK
jgi:hypothetical protein